MDQKVARAFGEHAALVDEVGTVDDAEGLAHIVVGDHHANAAGAQLENNLLYLGDRDRVDGGERFVHQQELRLGDKRAGDFEAAALAARKRKGLLARHGPEVQLVEMGLHRGGALAPRDADGFDDGEDVLLDRQLAEHGGLLRQVTQPVAGALVHPQAREVQPAEADRAAGWRDQPHHHVKGGRFARAVGPEQADDLAGAEAQTDAVDDRAGAEGLDEALRGEFSGRAHRGAGAAGTGEPGGAGLLAGVGRRSGPLS